MLKGLWRSVVRWWRSLLGGNTRRAAVAATELPPLSDPDYEYLFMQLLEGVAHGWQQPRVNKFFYSVKQRAPKSQWLAWINGFGYRLVNSASPNEELARKMIQLSELDCGEVTTLAGEFGHELLGRIYGNSADEFLPEFAVNDLPELEYAEWGIAASDAEVSVEYPAVSLPIMLQHEPVEMTRPNINEDETYAQDSGDLEAEQSNQPIFGEVPPELRIAKKAAFVPTTPIQDDASMAALPPPPLATKPENIEPLSEIPPEPDKVISIEEFAEMLQSDPDLVQEISQQLGLNTTDPQLVLDGVLAQMQQQIPDGQEP